MSEFLIISGLSGAGRSTAADALEDQGWFVVDNLPPTLISKVAELTQRPGSSTSHVALVVGTGAFFEDLAPALDQLRDGGAQVRILFLEAADDVLVRRYEGSRRRHPLQEQGVAEAVMRERERLKQVRAVADVTIDTSDLNVHQLRARMLELFSGQDSAGSMRTSIMSFGYKHGLPLDVDMVLDCRFLPNPHWDPKLRPMTGMDTPVRDYVLSQPETGDFLRRLDALLELLLPAYVKEGKAYFTMAVGCTGGRHRSVVLAEEIAKLATRHGVSPTVSHRDIDK